jgi:hypothetical protein
MLIKIKVFNDIQEITSKSFDPVPSLKKILTIMFKQEKVFVYIPKTVYEKLKEFDNRITDELDELSFEKNKAQNDDILTLLNNDIVIVKINNYEEISKINELRGNFSDNTIYCIIEETNKYK